MEDSKLHTDKSKENTENKQPLAINIINWTFKNLMFIIFIIILIFAIKSRFLMTKGCTEYCNDLLTFEYQRQGIPVNFEQLDVNWSEMAERKENG